LKDKEKRRLKRRERHLQPSAGRLNFPKTCSTRDAESDKPIRRVVIAEEIPECRVEHQSPKETEGEDEFILIIDEREFEPEEIDINIRRGKAADPTTGPAAPRDK
jgi:hypothetical protein